MEIATKSGRTVCVLMHKAPELLATANHTLINCVDNVSPDYHTMYNLGGLNSTKLLWVPLRLISNQDPTQCYAVFWHNWQRKRAPKVWGMQKLCILCINEWVLRESVFGTENWLLNSSIKTRYIMILKLIFYLIFIYCHGTV